MSFSIIKKQSHFEAKIERSEIRRSLGVGGQSQIKPKRVAPSSRRLVSAFYKTNPNGLSSYEKRNEPKLTGSQPVILNGMKDLIVQNKAKILPVRRSSMKTIARLSRSIKPDCVRQNKANFPRFQSKNSDYPKNKAKSNPNGWHLQASGLWVRFTKRTQNRIEANIPIYIGKQNEPKLTSRQETSNIHCRSILESKRFPGYNLPFVENLRMD